MREVRTVVTKNWRVTIPAEIRKALDLDEGDTVVWSIENGVVHLRKSSSMTVRRGEALWHARDASPDGPEESEDEVIEENVQQMFHNVNTRWPES